MFRELFSMPEFCPDYLKIYPTLVVRGTKLYEIWKKGEYEPIETEAAARLVAEVKSSLPPWVRLQRIQRDIPAGLIEAGVKKGNLRQLARELLEKEGGRCRCIRCREVGLAALRGNLPDRKNVKKKVIKYEVCGGLEHFISYEDAERDILIGFLRLRFPATPFRKELKNAALIRELHVYGPLVPLGARGEGSWQHRGYGEMLLGDAEKIACEGGFKKIATMSGVGAREYYRRFGYRRQGFYMCKRLDKRL
jgi:elongator complex protein 3